MPRAKVKVVVAPEVRLAEIAASIADLQAEAAKLQEQLAIVEKVKTLEAGTPITFSVKAKGKATVELKGTTSSRRERTIAATDTVPASVVVEYWTFVQNADGFGHTGYTVASSDILSVDTPAAAAAE